MFCLSLAVSMEQGPRDLWQEWASAPSRSREVAARFPAVQVWSLWSLQGLFPCKELRCRWQEPVQITPPALS